MKRSKFSLSNYKLFSCNQGKLVPCGLTEVLPGDTVQQATSALVRVSPLLAPVMHPVEVKIHHWFVPHRLVWADWEKFITGGPDGMDASVFPTMNISEADAGSGSLADYLGIPRLPNASSILVSALPFRAYALLWNEWYRDQDLQSKLVVSTASDADTTSSRVLQEVCWEKDYFTTCRPWTQKGPEVTLPLSGTAPVRGIGTSDDSFPTSNVGVKDTAEGVTTYASARDAAGPSKVFIEEDPNRASYPGVFADLSQVGAPNINELREAFAIQRYEEARARYGSRYTEYLRYLGVRSSDARLQRPEYLGGGKQTIQFSEVLQTGVTTDGDDTEGVGNLKGHGIGALRSNRYRRFFEEHGYIISVLSVKPRTMYAQSVARHFGYRTKEDFFQKELQHIGQQEVFNREVYGDSSTPGGVFGYQDRYDHYRRQESTVAGEFRDTLDFWHMARVFTSQPVLNAAFVKSNPTDRIYASTATHQLWIMANHSIQARRIVAASGSSHIF